LALTNLEERVIANALTDRQFVMGSILVSNSGEPE